MTLASNTAPQVGENPTEQMQESGKTSIDRHRILRGLLCVFVLTVFVAVNWPYLYVSHDIQSIAHVRLPFDLPLNKIDDSIQIVDPVEAGWPNRFYIHHPMADGLDEIWFSWGSLALNVTLAISCLIAMVLYLRPKSNSDNRLSLTDLLLMVTVIAGGFGVLRFQARQAQEEIKIAKELEVSGKVVRQAYGPAFLVRRLPDWVLRDWRRVTGVALHEPNEQQVQKLCRLSHLRSIRLGGGQYDLAEISRLPSMRYLQDLRLAGRKLDATSVAAVSRCKLLQQLNLTSTNCAGGALESLGSLTHLKKLMVLGTLIPMGAWENAAIKDRVEELALSRPHTGQGGELKLDSWGKLSTLSIDSLDQLVNPNALTVNLQNMDSLKSLALDGLQLYDLQLDNLPKLESINSSFQNVRNRLADDESAPLRLWVRRVALRQCGAIDHLYLHTHDFESLALVDTPKLITLLFETTAVPGDGEMIRELDVGAETIERILQAIESANSVRSISLRGMNFGESDFSSLLAESDAVTWDFQHSQLSEKGVASLEGDQIRSLSLQETNLGQSEINLLLSKLPALEKIFIPAETSAIRIEDKLELKKLAFSQHRQSSLTALRLKNVPKFESPMLLGPGARYTFVENAPQLSGLGILAPVPNAVVTGVPGLRWFCGGGASMSDENVSSVLQAKDLTHLTIGYSNAKTDAFERLTDLPRLQELRVPGASLQTERISEWKVPASLTKLDVRDCGLGAEATGHLIQRGNWQMLRLSGNQIDVASLNDLSSSDFLSSLAIGDVELTTTDVQNWGDKTLMERLDLPGCTLKPGVISLLAKKMPSLRVLSLEGATMDWKELNALLTSMPRLRFQVDPTDLPVQLATKLISKNRLASKPNVFEIWFRSERRSLLGYDARGFPVYSDPTKSSGPDEFEFPDWPPDLFRDEVDSNSPLPRVFRQFSRSFSQTNVMNNAPKEPGINSQNSVADQNTADQNTADTSKEKSPEESPSASRVENDRLNAEAGKDQ